MDTYQKTDEHKKRLEQFALIQDIREQLTVGYRASRWEDKIRISYIAPGVEQHYYVKTQEEWEELKPTLGRHSDKMVALLKYSGEVINMDISTYLVYGSISRPINSLTMSQIGEAVFMEAEQPEVGKLKKYYTYIAVPALLPKELVDTQNLVFISR